MAESEGVSLTKEEAAAYLAEMSDCELDDEVLKQAAGGADCYSRSHRQCNY